MNTPMRHGIAVASEEAAGAARRSQLLQDQRRLMASRVRTIDAVLANLEASNLAGKRDIDAAIRAQVDRLPRVVGVPLSCGVKLARTSRRLHAALLDWQQEVLDTLVPARRTYVAVDAIFDTEER